MWKSNYMNIFIFVVTLSKTVYTEEDDEKLNMLVSTDQHLPTPRLEDFFWTGSGDGPPPPDLAEPLPSPVTPMVLTTTILATVYLDSYPPQAVTDKTSGDCISNCGDAVPDSLEPDIPEDRRYWLLTVIQGSTPDSLQIRLARLYQKAFLRQQERHLGIIKSLDAPTSRKKHEVQSFIVHRESEARLGTTSTSLPAKNSDMQSSIVNLPLNTISEDLVNISTHNLYTNLKLLLNDSVFHTQVIQPTKTIKQSWVLANPTVVVQKRDVRDVEDYEDSAYSDNREDLIDIPLEVGTSNETVLFKREIIKPEQQPPVRVHIQNVTESSETGSVQIVYVVLVGGRAVPAAVAARDMRLVRDAEVATELGAAVTTKAEPAYLRAAEGLEGGVSLGGVHGAELWALVVGGVLAVVLVVVLLALLCIARRKKSIKSAASMRAYRSELIREMERSQMRQLNDGKDTKLVGGLSPSRTRPSSVLLPVYRAASVEGSSSSSSGVSEVAAALRRRQKKPHALRIPKKKRVGTTDSLLEAAGVESSDSALTLASTPPSPPTPTSYLSMPSVNAFPRGNMVEPLSKILEPVSVRHLDIDSPGSSAKGKQGKVGEETVPRRQMASQLVRLGSIDRDPGVIGPLVWDLHCQRIKEGSKPPSPARSSAGRDSGPTRMRQRFNELMDDASTLFAGARSSPSSQETYTLDKRDCKRGNIGSGGVAQARNDAVRLPGSPYSALDTVRGRSAGTRVGITAEACLSRPRTSVSRPHPEKRAQPTRAWGPTPPHSLSSHVPMVDTTLITTEGRLAPEDPALPLISAIKSEIQRVRDNANPSSH